MQFETKSSALNEPNEVPQLPSNFAKPVLDACFILPSRCQHITLRSLLCYKLAMSAATHIAGNSDAIGHLFQYARLILSQANEGLQTSNNVYDMQRHHDRLHAINDRLVQIGRAYTLSDNMHTNLAEWTDTCASLLEQYAAIADLLQDNAEMLASSIPGVVHLPVAGQCSDGPGRRKLIVNLAELCSLQQQQYSLKEVAHSSGISVDTLRRRRLEAGLPLRHEVAQITGIDSFVANNCF